MVRHALRDCDEQRIAGRVAVVVVYLLEVVHVDEREREHAAAPVLPQRGVDELRHERAIRQTGELVVERAVGELLLEALAFGYVERRREEQGLVEDRDRLAGREQRVCDAPSISALCSTVAGVGGAQAVRTGVAAVVSVAGVSSSAGSGIGAREHGRRLTDDGGGCIVHEQASSRLHPAPSRRREAARPLPSEDPHCASRRVRSHAVAP